MKIIDEKGRFFGKVSAIDLVLLLAVVVLVIGFIHNRTSDDIGPIVRADTPLYLSMYAGGVRRYTIDAVNEGDLIFRQLEPAQALGTVVQIEARPHYRIESTSCGNARLVQVENRYDLHMVLAARGTVAATGFFINGISQMSPGQRVPMQSNKMFTTFTITGVVEPNEPRAIALIADYGDQPTDTSEIYE